MTPTAEDDAPAVICSEDCDTLADVETADSGAVVPGGSAVESGGTVVESGGTVVEGSGIDMADTRLVCCCGLPRTDLRL